MVIWKYSAVWYIRLHKLLSNLHILWNMHNKFCCTSEILAYFEIFSKTLKLSISLPLPFIFSFASNIIPALTCVTVCTKTDLRNYSQGYMKFFSLWNLVRKKRNTKCLWHCCISYNQSLGFFFFLFKMYAFPFSTLSAN